MNYTFDHSLFLWLNFDGGGFLDSLMMAASNPLAWSWLYLVVLYMVWRRGGWREMLLFIVMVGIALALSDMIAGVFKHVGLLKNLWPAFPARLRPMHTPELQGMMHVITSGGLYGTVSAHAATTIAIAVLASVFVRRWWMWCAMAAMTIIICYSRIYLAFHFPFDILLGLCTGVGSVALAWGLVQGAKGIFCRIKQSCNN